jgi:hypothetical protein
MEVSGVPPDYVFASSKIVESGSAPGFLNRLMGNTSGRQYARCISALGISCLSLVALFNRNIRQVETVEPEVQHQPELRIRVIPSLGSLNLSE